MLKIIVAGCSTEAEYEILKDYLNNFNDGKEIEIISAGERGVDALVEHLACEKKIKLKRFSAHWSERDKRNKEMAEYADVLFAFWNGSQKVKDIVGEMKKLHKNVVVCKSR